MEVNDVQEKREEPLDGQEDDDEKGVDGDNGGNDDEKVEDTLDDVKFGEEQKEGERVREVINALLEDIGSGEQETKNTSADIGDGNTLVVHLPPDSPEQPPRKRARSSYSMTHISRRDNLIPEVVPFYVKDRIRRDIGGYDRFDLVIPFAGFDFSRPEYDEDEYEDYYNEAIALGESCTDAAPETEATGEVRWDEDAVPESLDLSDESEGAGEGEEEELDDEIKEGITEEMEEEEPEEEGEDEEEILPFLSAIIERWPKRSLMKKRWKRAKRKNLRRPRRNLRGDYPSMRYWKACWRVSEARNRKTKPST